jgi:histidine triad (HIT) family protein
VLDANCIFCRIIRGEVPSFRILEDDRTLVFMDINPANPGHALVIPKVHAETIFTLEEPWLTATMLVAQRVAQAVHKAFQPYGLNIVQANGPGAAQSVPHFHWHVLPRAEDDGLLMNWPLQAGDMPAIADGRGAHSRGAVSQKSTEQVDPRRGGHGRHRQATRESVLSH